MLDITAFAVAETATFDVLDAEENPIRDAQGNAATITHHTPGSAEFARAAARKNNRLTDRLRKKGKASATAAEIARERAEFLADLTISFNHFTYPVAEGLSPREMFIAAYSDQKIGFIWDRFEARLGDWANFSKGSATS